MSFQIFIFDQSKSIQLRFVSPRKYCLDIREFHIINFSYCSFLIVIQIMKSSPIMIIAMLFCWNIHFFFFLLFYWQMLLYFSLKICFCRNFLNNVRVNCNTYRHSTTIIFNFVWFYKLIDVNLYRRLSLMQNITRILIPILR